MVVSSFKGKFPEDKEKAEMLVLFVYRALLAKAYWVFFACLQPLSEEQVGQKRHDPYKVKREKKEVSIVFWKIERGKKTEKNKFHC